MLREAVFWAYENLFVGLTVGVISLYIASGVIGDWVAWIIVPATLVITIITTFRFAFCLYDNGIASWVYRKFIQLWNGTIEIFGTIYNYIHLSKFSKILWFLAALNACVLGYYVYINVDIFQIFRTLFNLTVDFVRYISDPVAILRSFNALLKNLHVDKLMIHLKDRYFVPLIKDIEKGNPEALGQIFFGTVILILFGFIPVCIQKAFNACRNIFTEEQARFAEMTANQYRMDSPSPPRGHSKVPGQDKE